MATEISGGGMYFKSGVDNSELKGNLKDLESTVSKSMGKIGDLGKTIDKSFDDAVKNVKGKYANSTKEMTQATRQFGSESTKAIGTVATGFKALDAVLSGLGLIGLLTLAIELFKKLWEENKSFKDSFNGLKQNIKLTAQALQDGGYIEAKQNMMLLKQEVKLAGDGFISKGKVLKHYNETLGKSMGEVRSLGEVENKLTNNGPAFIEMMFLKAKAMAAYAEAAKLQIQSETEQSKELSNWEKMKSKFTDMNAGDFFTSVFNPSSREKLFANSEKSYRDRMSNRAFNQSNLIKQVGDQALESAAKIAAANKSFDLFAGNYQGKTARGNAFQSANALVEMLKEITDSGKKFEIQFATNADSERDKINKFFDDLKFKAEQFNKNPKNKIKVAPRYFNDIENNRNTSLSLSDYSQETKNLIDEFEIRKKEYADYEALKYKVGSDTADKQYKYLIGKHRTYLEALEAEEKALWDKGSLNVSENDRFIKVQQLIVKARADQKSDESKWLADSLMAYATYEQKKAAIITQREDDIKKAIASGHTELIDGINDFAARALQQLDDSKAQERGKLGGFFDDMILTSKKAVKAQIDNIKHLLKNAVLTPDQRAALLKSLKDTEALLGKDSRQIEREQLQNKLAAIDAEIKKITEDTPNAKNEIDKLMRDRAGVTQRLKDLDAFAEKITNLKAVAAAVGQLGDMLSSLGDANPKLAALGETLQDVAGNAEMLASNWQKLEDDALKSSDKIQMAAAFIINALNNILKSAAQNRMKEAEALQNITDFQRGYNLALIEEQKIKESMTNSVFFKDNMATVKANLSAQIKLVNEYSKAMGELNNGMIKVGTTKEKRDWARVGGSVVAGAGTGALIGASAGAGILSLPGSAIGGIIGGVVGLIGGMLEKRKVIDVYDSLLKRYPDLINAEGTLNDALAKSLLSSNLLDAKTKDTLQYVTNLAEEYKKAQAEIDAVIKDLIGDVGGNIMDALITDFKGGGTDAGKAFREGFAKSLENMYKDVIYTAIFGQGLTKLQKDIEAGFKSGDMNAMETSLYEFLDTQEKNASAAQELMKKMQDYAKSKGIDIFTPNETADSKKNKNSLSGAYAQASQESIDLLGGQTMAFKIAQLQSNVHLKNIEDIAFKNLDCAMKIAANTGATVDRLDSAVSELKSIKNKMDNNANNALAAGL